MAGSSHAVDISKVTKGEFSTLTDSVAVEEPLEIRLGFTTPDGRASRSISITMRTPGNDKELAAGFLFTESIISKADDITSIDVCGPPAPDSGNHNVIRVELAPEVEVDLGRLQRHFYTTSSCGVCGKASLDALRITGVTELHDNKTSFSHKVLATIPDKLLAAQHTFEETGGLHAAAAFSPDGELVVTMEDVGRHNAVDKVIGACFRSGSDPAGCTLMVSGRVSFEVVQKCLAARIPAIAAVSAPTSLAVDLAREANMRLVGFVRGERALVYAG